MDRRVRFVLCAVGVVVGAAAPLDAAFAHEGGPHGVLRRWELDPLVVIAMCIFGLVYARGVGLLWNSSRPGTGIRFWEAGCYAAGWLVLVLALISPLHPLGEVLFAAHMTQHELLMLVAAPLIVLGRPLLPFLWTLPVGWARAAGARTRSSGWRRFWRMVIHPLNAWLIHFVVLWVWHAPVLFNAAVRNDIVHDVQHISFFGSALLFWWAVIHGGYGRMGYGMAILYIFTTGLHNGVLGLLLTFATDVWYPVYRLTAPEWGLTALEDQQIGGLIMWVPAALVYIAAACALLVAWLKESEKMVVRREAEIDAAAPSRTGGSSPDPHLEPLPTDRRSSQRL